MQFSYSAFSPLIMDRVRARQQRAMSGIGALPMYPNRLGPQLQNVHANYGQQMEMQRGQPSPYQPYQRPQPMPAASRPVMAPEQPSTDIASTLSNASSTPSWMTPEFIQNTQAQRQNPFQTPQQSGSYQPYQRPQFSGGSLDSLLSGDVGSAIANYGGSIPAFQGGIANLGVPSPLGGGTNGGGFADMPPNTGSAPTVGSAWGNQTPTDAINRYQYSPAQGQQGAPQRNGQSPLSNISTIGGGIL